MQAFYDPPPELLTLDTRDLTALDAILAKVAPDAGALSAAAFDARVARRRAGRRARVTSGRVRPQRQR